MKNNENVDSGLNYLKVEESTFAELIHRHQKKVFAYIRHSVRDKALAEDIFQDTFLKVFQSVKEGKYTDGGKFISWVMRIAHNLIIDHFRIVKQMNVISADNYEADLFNLLRFAADNIEDKLIKQQIHTDVRKMIRQLPVEQKEIIILRHYAGLSFKEIANFTDVSINTALGRMRYALVSLRKIMGENKLSLVLN